MLPTLNIVVYTDYNGWFTDNPVQPDGGLRDLKAFVTEKTKHLFNVNFCFVSRHTTNPPTLITKTLLTSAHELWVFGFRQNNTKNQPDNNLKESEIEALKEFIREGKVGIFLTGDHSSSESEEDCSKGNHEDYSSLGRALGENFPIAGLFRDWQGPPTNCNEGEFDLRDTFNTQEGSNPCNLEVPGLGTDELPQNIILTLKNCLPHRLFTYFDSNQNLRRITKLPDHAHEGRVVDIEEARKKLDSKWPEGEEWAPVKDNVIANWDDIVVVAAKGRDKRFPDENRISNLVTAFDGDPVGLSRMVVDSSFHHYLDFNTFSIPERLPNLLPKPDSDLDQIAEYFGNLAWWLAPKAMRDQIKIQILLSLTGHMEVRQVWNLSDLKIGAAGREVLKRTTGLGRLQWLIGKFPFEKRDPIDEVLSLLLLGERHDSVFTRIIRPELPLGLTLRFCDLFLVENKIDDFTQVKPEGLLSLGQRLQANLLETFESFRTALVGLSPSSAAAFENLSASFKQ